MLLFVSIFIVIVQSLCFMLYFLNKTSDLIRDVNKDSLIDWLSKEKQLLHNSHSRVVQFEHFSFIDEFYFER
jgi:hypothetical protein